jgi:hypothetical protein
VPNGHGGDDHDDANGLERRRSPAGPTSGSGSVAVMDFEETLTALLGMVGRRVDVTVMARSPRSMVAAFSGRLVRGADLTHPSDERASSEALRFAVAGDASEEEGRGGDAAFVLLDPWAFRGARWGEGLASARALTVRLGAVEVVFEPEDPAAADD